MHTCLSRIAQDSTARLKRRQLDLGYAKGSLSIRRKNAAQVVSYIASMEITAEKRKAVCLVVGKIPGKFPGNSKNLPEMISYGC